MQWRIDIFFSNATSPQLELYVCQSPIRERKCMTTVYHFHITIIHCTADFLFYRLSDQKMDSFFPLSARCRFSTLQFSRSRRKKISPLPIVTFSSRKKESGRRRRRRTLTRFHHSSLFPANWYSADLSANSKLDGRTGGHIFQPLLLLLSLPSSSWSEIAPLSNFVPGIS